MVDEKLSPEDRAKELLKKNHDKEEFFFDDCCKDDRLISSLYQSLKWWEKQRETSKFSNPVFSARIITELGNFLYNKSILENNETLLASTLHFMDLYSECNNIDNNKTLKKFSLNEGLATILIYLKNNGSSKNQGYLSLAEWSKQSVSTIEKHHISLQFKDSLSEVGNIFYLNEIKIMRVLLTYRDNQFPSKGTLDSPVNKTYRAFEKFKEEFKKHIYAHPTARSLNVEFYDLEAPHERYIEMREEFLTHF